MLCCVSALEYPVSESRRIGLNYPERGIHGQNNPKNVDWPECGGSIRLATNTPWRANSNANSPGPERVVMTRVHCDPVTDRRAGEAYTCLVRRGIAIFV
jgi:hypothetical protein